MRRLVFVLFLLFALLLSSCSLPELYFLDGEKASDEKNTFTIAEAVESPASFTLLLTSDEHFNRTEGGVYYENELFFSWIDTYQSEHPASEKAKHLTHMISLGDITENSKPEEFILFSEYKDKLAERGIKTYAVKGNHDIRAGTDHKAYWEEFVGTPPYHAFAHRGISFYLLDTATRALGRRQRQELERAVTQDSRPKLFFSHMPLYGKPSLVYFVLSDTQERESIIRLMVRNKGLLYLAGHYHQGDLLYSFTRTTSEFILGSFHGRTSLFEMTKPRWYLLCFDSEEKSITIMRYQVEVDRTISEKVMASLPCE